MCGISGTVGWSMDLSPMIKAQHKRGPDNDHMMTCMVGDGSRADSFVAFGHNRLSILDLSDRGNQPMTTERYMLTYNGEIYNFKDLPGHGNDAARLLNSIKKIGLEDTLSLINGMYAFALLDKVEQKIYLVADRFAQKPLYYYEHRNQFAFASAPAALTHLRERWHINKEALRSYWMLGGVMYDSIFLGIKKVPAAHCVEYDIRAGMVSKIWRYWSPQYIEDTTDIKELVLDAINLVKVADVPVYLFLSGGIDSSVVASQCVGMNAIHLDGPERHFAEIVAEKFAINLHTVCPTDVVAYDAICDYSRQSGEPSMSGIVPWITAKETARFCKVAITANGADELFFGYDRTEDSTTIKQLSHLFRCDFGPAPEMPKIDPRLSSGRWLELMTYIQHDLNKSLDFAAMSHSLEVRSPFLDHRLVEMALSIPQAQHGRKNILKEILAGYGFSHKFLNRPKMGFSLYKTPIEYDQLKDAAYFWAIKEGYMDERMDLSKRDSMYLRAAAAGFYCWYKTWAHKL